MSARIDLIALSLLPPSRWRRIAGQLAGGEPPAEILYSHCDEAARRGNRLADAGRLRERAADALVSGERRGLRAVLRTDPEYPSPLREIVDPPPVLWIAGSVAVLARVAVAIVGSRAGSPYALSVAERLAADLAAAGIVVVSGLARGVDSAAHRGALSASGPTIAVLGCGADVAYPPEHQPLSTAIAASGAVVSELVPGTSPRAIFFPLRNRIISGLARAVVVIEAGEKSGSLITARCALEQGRDVLAVPGNVLTGRNRGGHALLRDGARLVETAEDIVDELGLARLVAAGSRVAAHGAADEVLAALDPGEPADLGRISERSGLSAALLLARLMDLELRGLVRREAGGRFVRVGQTC